MTEAALFQDMAVMMSIVGAIAIIFSKLRWPKILGFLAAGILMNGHTWGGSFLQDQNSVYVIGQLGIIFMMFALGLDFSPSQIKSVRHIALPVAIVDVLVMIWLGSLIGTKFFGWSPVQALFLGAALCDSATTSLAKAIDDMGWGARPFVKCVFAATIFEDILCVGVVALITGLDAGRGMDIAAVSRELGALVLFFIAVFVFGVLFVTRLMERAAKTDSDETLLLAVLGSCFLVCTIAYKLDFSTALAAFLVGMLCGNTAMKERVAKLVSPLKTMFSAIFFVSIGLLVDPEACLQSGWAIAGLSIAVLAGKFLNCFTASILSGLSLKNSVQTGFAMAQIGEFAYMVALIYLTRHVEEGSSMYQTVVGVSLVTTLLNPILIKFGEPAGEWLEKRLPSGFMSALERYGEWLERFRESLVPGETQRRLRSTALKLLLSWLLVLVIFLVCGLMAGFDYARFSKLFDAHKRIVFCVAANLAAFPVVYLLYRLSGRMAILCAGAVVSAREKQTMLRRQIFNLVHLFVKALLMCILFLTIAALNINMAPGDFYSSLALFALIVLGFSFGWSWIRRAGIVARRNFNQALQAEERRRRREKESQTHEKILAVPVSSSAIGGTLRTLDLRAKTGAFVTAIERHGRLVRNPSPDWHIAGGDVLHVAASAGDFAKLAAIFLEERHDSQAPDANAGIKITVSTE